MDLLAVIIIVLIIVCYFPRFIHNISANREIVSIKESMLEDKIANLKWELELKDIGILRLEEELELTKDKLSCVQGELLKSYNDGV